jgi:hypothetical protein
MAILKATPDLILPFRVSGGPCIEVNRVLDLDAATLRAAVSRGAHPASRNDQ